MDIIRRKLMLVTITYLLTYLLLGLKELIVISDYLFILTWITFSLHVDHLQSYTAWIIAKLYLLTSFCR